MNDVHVIYFLNAGSQIGLESKILQPASVRTARTAPIMSFFRGATTGVLWRRAIKGLPYRWGEKIKQLH